MNDTLTFSRKSFWQFSCDFYSKPQIEQACLALQDEFDLNVNIMLFLLWYSAAQGRLLNTAQIESLLLAIDKPQQWVMEYRLFRKHLWSKMLANKDQPNPEIKQALLSAELKLEEQVQSVLFDYAKQHLAAANDPCADEVHLIELEFIAHENLDAYVTMFHSEPSPQLWQLQQDLLNRLLQITNQTKAA